jgi:hypothetical protein
MTGRTPKAAFLIALTLCFLALPAAPALASFHLMQIREVYPGSAANPDSEYVELQMWSSGQNLVGGHFARTFDAAATPIATSTFPSNVANAANQSTLLLATPQAEGEFGIVADGPLTPGALPAGGAVCWETIDCVSWGSFAGSLPSSAGTPAAPGGIPDGMALRRSISRGCATALESIDDTDQSQADFEAVFPAPRPNSVPPSERLCTGSGSGGAGSGPGTSKDAPQTFLRRKPAKKTRDRTPTFRFASDESSVHFECKLDGKRFRACSSPLTTKRLGFGPHRFRVRAVDHDGVRDASPADYRFTVLRPAR